MIETIILESDEITTISSELQSLTAEGFKVVESGKRTTKHKCPDHEHIYEVCDTYYCKLQREKDAS